MGTALLVGGVLYFGFFSLAGRLQAAEVDHRSESEAMRFQSAIDGLRRDTQLLIRLPGLSALSEQAPRSARSQAEYAHLRELFIRLLETREHYAQIRYISFAKHGPELLRVERQRDQIRVVPDSELQRKGHRDYVKLGAGLESGEVRLHTPSLNREYGALALPHQPVLRSTGTHLVDGGKRGGLVVINMDLSGLFSSLTGQREGRLSYVTNQEGDFLLHPVAEQCFGFELGRRFLAQGEFAGFEKWLKDGGREGIRLESRRGGEPVVFRRLWLDKAHSRFIVLGIAGQEGALGAGSSRLALYAGALALTLTGLALLLAYGMASRMSRPLERMAKIAKQVADGNEPPPLPVERDDEVGTLARTFSAMLESQSERQAAMVELNTRLKQTNLDLEHFAQLASHDLREPARRVAVMADFLLEDEAENFSPEGKEVTMRLHDAAEKILIQITEIRALTQVGEGRLVRVQTDLGALVSGCLGRFEDRITERGIRVRCEVLPRLPVYENLIRILYTKLIDNALSHSSGNGIALTFDAENDRGRWVLGVRNEGSAIAPEALDGVFRPLRSLEASDGPGMGLSICRRVIERHAGRIWAESGPDFVHIKFTVGGSYEGSEGSFDESGSPHRDGG